TEVGALLKGIASFSSRADDLFSQNSRAYTTASGGVEAIFHGDIVVDQDRLNLNAIGMGQLGGGFEVEDIASVVLDDEQDAFAAVYGLGALVHLVGSGGREDFAGAGAVKHAHAH